MTTLVVTNDFPPRIGGIESFVAAACRFLDDDVAVLTSTAPGAHAWDADAGYPIERLPGPLLPTPAVGRAAVDLLRRHGADRVLFGAAAPLALLAPTLRTAGAERIVALTHGHETWWATLPGSRRLLRRIGDEVDVLTTISDYVTARVAPALSPAGRSRLVRLPPPVDLDVFVPAPGRAETVGLNDVRCPTVVGKRTPEGPLAAHIPTAVGERTPEGPLAAHIPTAVGERTPAGPLAAHIPTAVGERTPERPLAAHIPTAVGERTPAGPLAAHNPTAVGKRTPEGPRAAHIPTAVGKRTPEGPPGRPRRVIAVGRMVRRKGFDTLLRSWELIMGAPGAAGHPYELVLVGDGPERTMLERRVEHANLPAVRFTGALDRAGVLAELQRADVCAFPVRTRLAGLDPEGLGLAPLEAAACGLPVVVGRSGGAPETVRPGETGYVVEPDDPYELAVRLVDLLADPERAHAMGAAGRRFVGERYGADRARRVLRTALGLADQPAPGVATV